MSKHIDVRKTCLNMSPNIKIITTYCYIVTNMTNELKYLHLTIHNPNKESYQFSIYRSKTEYHIKEDLKI